MVDSANDQPVLGPEAEQDVSEDHIALIYETAEEEISTTTQLIRVGLEKGELCVHVSDNGNGQEVVEALRAEHIDVDKAVANGSLILANKNEIYFKTGRFDPDWTIRVITNIADLAKDYGFTAMRIISNMSWVLENLPGVERWAEYEAKLNSLSPGISVRTICQYGRQALPPETLLAAVKAHPKVASHGSVCKNHFYVPADLLLLQGGYAGAELDHVLDSIRRSSAWEADLKDRQLEVEQTKKHLENETSAKKRLEAALEESRRRFGEFAERTSDWVWEIGRDGTYTYSSPRVKDILGLRPEEVVGKNPLDLASAEDRASSALARAVGDRAPIIALEREVRHKDGHTVYLEMSGAPLFDRDGEFAGYRGMYRDITGRKAAKQAIDESRKKAETCEAEAEARGQKVTVLETDLAQLRAAMEERDAALVSLNEALATSQHELSQVREGIERLGSSLAGREEELEAARRTVEERGAAVAERDGAVAALQEAARGKEAELASVREALRGSQDEVARKEEDIVQLHQQADLRGSELSTAQEALAQKEADLVAARERAEGLTADIARIRGELGCALSSAGDLKAGLEARDGELKEARDIIARKDEEISQGNVRIGLLDADVSKAGAELSAALALIESTRADLAGRTSELEGSGETIARKDQELARAGARIGELEPELEGARSELASALAQAEAAKADLAALAGDLQATQEAQASLGKERERLVRLVREQGDLITSMREAIDKFTSELNERESLITTLQAAAAFRESELITRKSVAERNASEAEQRAREADGLRAELQAAGAELADLREALAEVQEANAGKGASIAALSTKLEETEAEIRAAKAAMSTKAAELERDREVLDESNSRFRALFEQAGVAVVRTDLEGRLVEANGKFFEMLDRTPEELIGSTYHDYTHRDDMIFIAGLFDQLINGRARSGTLLARFTRKLGTVIRASVSMSVVRDERGSPKFIMALIEDRTEQMLAEQALLDKEKDKAKEKSAAAKPAGLADEHQEKIVHDLNDSLTVILGSVSLAKEYVIPEGRMYNKLKQIESASVAVRSLASRLTGPAPAGPAAPDNAAPDLVRGKGRVLLMDDDESVLEAIGDLLSYLGYGVGVARDGAEALSLCRKAREDGQPFDLAILDLAIASGMDGREAAQAIHAENPDLKLAVSSGFLADPAMADPGSFGFDMAIAKPYSAEMLSKKVGDLIAQA